MFSKTIILIFLVAAIEFLFFEAQLESLTSMLTVLIASFLGLIAFSNQNLNSSWRLGAVLKDLNNVCVLWFGAYVLLFVLKMIGAIDLITNQRVFFIGHGLQLITLVFFFKALSEYFFEKFRLKRTKKKRIAVVGKSSHTLNVIKNIMSRKSLEYSLAGYFAPGIFRDVELPKLGGINDLKQYVQGSELQEVWIALSIADREELSQIINHLKLSNLVVKLIPDQYEFQIISNPIQDYGDLPIVNISKSPISGWSYVIKEVEDKLLSILIILMISPIMFVAFFMVKLTSRGPAFYTQERIGWNGRKFNIIKFRSMYVDNEKGGVKWGGADKKGLTPIGDFLRKSNIDELPQFFNVLKGDMTIVGPRPERPMFVDQFKNEIPGYMQKHLVKAGITGWAQVNGWRGDTDLAERVNHDLFYIRNWSLWFDLKIILMTVFEGFLKR